MTPTGRSTRSDADTERDPLAPDPQATATELLGRYGEQATARGAPVWVQWRWSGDGAEARLQAREVPGPQGLFGCTVDPDWQGAAVVGTGRFRLLDQAHEPPAALQPGFAGGLTMTCAVGRDGCVGWRMRLPDGTFYDRVPEEGFMLDVLRRALGLATPPPPSSIAPLELGAWVAAIASTSAAEGRRLDWQETLRLHPALGPDSDENAEQDLRLLRARNWTEDWDLMRRLVASGLATAATPEPEVAAWMDAGMFSRWVLDGLPSLRDLLGVARPCLEPSSYRLVHHLARSLDDRESAG